MKVDSGVVFDFTGAAITTLAPGARVIIAGNPAAFLARYGPGLPLAGAFAGSLSNGGEIIRVVDSVGGAVALFAYGDSDPWPGLADGHGFALVLRGPNLDPALPGSWRASYSPGGKPGREDMFTIDDWRGQYFSADDLANPAKEESLWGAEADPDGDGVPNLVEYALGTSPIDPVSRPRVSAEIEPAGQGTPARLRATFQIREGVTGVSVTAQITAELGPAASWQPLAPGSTFSRGDNIAIVSVEQPEGAATTTQRFIRVKITSP